MSTRVNSTHPFFHLRDKLALLQFDETRDVSSSSLPFLQEYLQFYKLDFPLTTVRFHAVGTLRCKDYTIVAQYWLPNAAPKGTVFVLHGYYDHVGIFQKIIHYLLELDFVVVAYDQPGHGLSSGEQASINHFAEYVDIMQIALQSAQHLPKPWHAVGQSTGGGVLLHALLLERVANPFEHIVLMAPLVKPAGWNSAGWLYRLLKPFVKKIPRRYSNNSHDKTFVDFAHYVDPLQSRFLSVTWVGAMKEWLECFPSLAPVQARALLIQGDDDHTVAWQENLPLIRQKMPGIEVAMIPGGRHHLVNESTELRAQVFALVCNYLLASP